MTTMNDYRTVVVGTDGSALAGPTVARAAWLAQHDDADLVIVCAYSGLSRRDEAKNVVDDRRRRPHRSGARPRRRQRGHRGCRGRRQGGGGDHLGGADARGGRRQGPPDDRGRARVPISSSSGRCRTAAWPTGCSARWRSRSPSGWAATSSSCGRSTAKPSSRCPRTPDRRAAGAAVGPHSGATAARTLRAIAGTSPANHPCSTWPHRFMAVGGSSRGKMGGQPFPRRPRVSAPTPVPLSRAAVRWSLGHALPRTVLRRSARQGDLHGRMFVATQSGDLAALAPVLAELRDARPVLPRQVRLGDRGPCRRACAAVQPGCRHRPGPGGPGSHPCPPAGVGSAGRTARTTVPTLPAGDRAAGPHPLPQARVPGVQRPGRREAARPHPADRHRAARPGRPEEPGRPGSELLQHVAGHGHRGDPRGPGKRPGEGAQAGGRGRTRPRPRALLDELPPRRVGAARVRPLAARSTSTTCVDTRARTCSASSSSPRRTAWASPTSS